MYETSIVILLTGGLLGNMIRQLTLQMYKKTRCETHYHILKTVCTATEENHDIHGYKEKLVCK